jgi:hypothetical protein
LQHFPPSIEANAGAITDDPWMQKQLPRSKYPPSYRQRRKNMKLPITGGCLCGAVRYEILAKPIGGFNCHCRTCQKSIGAPYFAGMFVPASALAITGNYKEYATIAASGHTVYRAFCPECGTSLFGRNSAFTDIRPVAAATLDDPGIFHPQKDIWVANAQSWDYMNPDLPKFDGNPWH